MKAFLVGCSAAILAVINCATALGADAEAGKRLAQLRCAACHIIAPSGGQRTELADSPPFELIARKYPDVDSLAFNLMGPHAKMNFRLSPSDAANMAEYIHSLAK